jgi:hypothetical protein
LSGELYKALKDDDHSGQWKQKPRRRKMKRGLLFAESVNMENPHLFDYGAFARLAGS